MHYQVKVTCQALHVRTGPSISYRVTGMVYKNQTFDVDQIKKYSNGEYWYKHKGKNVWSCGYRAPLKEKYLTVTKNYDTASKPKPSNTKKPAKSDPGVDYNKLNDVLKANSNKGYLAPYDSKFTNQLVTGHRGSSKNKYTNYSPNPSNEQGYKYTDAEFIKARLKEDKKNVGANYFNSYQELEQKYYTSFNRYGIDYPDYTLSKSFCKVFFTRPDLNFTNGNRVFNDNIKNDPYFKYIMNINPNILLSLTNEGTPGCSHKFNMWLSQQASSMEISDEVIKTEDVGENFVGYKAVYGKNNHESISAGTFSVSYTDSQNLTIYNMHKAWVEYISQVFKGQLSPKEQYKGTKSNILSRVIDYACACYYFVLGPDGETILFGHKYYGVFPTNTPASSLSWSKGSMISKPEMNVTYAYWFREPISMLNMAEFNKVSGTTRGYMPTYNSRVGQSSDVWTGPPFITVETINGRQVYKLRYSA